MATPPKVFYMTEHPEIPVQCILAEIPQRFTASRSRVKYHFERRFGKVRYVQMLECNAAQSEIIGHEPLSSCFIMFGCPEIAALAMAAGYWKFSNIKLKICEAELAKQLEPQPHYGPPPPYELIQPRNDQSPFEMLNIDCLLTLFKYLDFGSICELAAADEFIRIFATEYKFRRTTSFQFYTKRTLEDRATFTDLRRDLYFLGPYIQHATVCSQQYDDTSVHHITSVIESCPNLVSLRIHYFDLSMHDITVLSRFRCLATAFILYRCRIRYRQWMHVLPSWPNLRELTVHNLINEDDSGVKYLLAPANNLHTFHLFGTRHLPAAAIRDLVVRNRKTLRSLKLIEIRSKYINTFDLTLQNTDLEFVGVELQKLADPSELLRLLQLPRLSGVHIRCLPLINSSEPIMKYLTALRLDRLELDYFPMSDQLKRAIVKCSSVRTLKLSTVGKVQAADVMEIVMKMPNMVEFELASYGPFDVELNRALRASGLMRSINFTYSPSSYPL